MHCGYPAEWRNEPRRKHSRTGCTMSGESGATRKQTGLDRSHPVDPSRNRFVLVCFHKFGCPGLVNRCASWAVGNARKSTVR